MFKAQKIYLMKSTIFVEVSYETRLFIESIIIYETYHPGGVVEIYAFDYIEEKWRNLWSVFDDPELTSNKKARNRPTPTKASRKFEPILKTKNIYTE